MPQISKFDEHSGFRHNSNITDIQTDHQGTVWVVQFTGVSKFTGKTFRPISSLNVSNGDFIRFRTTETGLNFVTDHFGAIFFINSDTLRPYAHNSTIIKLNTNNSWSDLYFDESGRLHISFSTIGYRIIELDGTVTIPFEAMLPKPEDFVAILRKGKLPFISAEPAVDRGAGVRQRAFSLLNEDLELLDTLQLPMAMWCLPQSVVRLPNNNYLLSTGWGHLIEFNDSQTLQKNGYCDYITRIFLDRKDGLWIATKDSGLHYYSHGIISKENRRIISGTTFASATTEDYEGGIWVLSHSDGLSQITNPEETYYNKELGHLNGNQITALDFLGNQLLACDESGTLTLIDPLTHQHQTIENPIPKGSLIRSLIYDSLKERIWLTDYAKVYYSDKDKWKRLDVQALEQLHGRSKIYLQPVTHDSFQFIGIHKKQVFLVDDTSISYTSPSFPGLITNVVLKNDSIWVAAEGGIYLLVNDTILDLSLEFPVLKKAPITSMTYFNNALWLSLSSDKSYFLKNGNLQRATFDSLTLPAGHFLSIGDSTMWLFSIQGCFLIEKENNSPSSPLHISGYQALSLEGASNVENNATTLFWGTRSNGIMRVDFNDLKKDPLQAVRLHFTGLKINNNPTAVTDEVYSISHRKSNIKITYVGLAFHSRMIQYRSRLKGLEAHWTPTEELSIQYATLPAGDYVFEVQARRLGGFWSNSQTLTFSVAPPYWQTWWFIAGCSLLALLIVFIIGSIRIRIIRKEQLLIIDRLKAEQDALQAQMDPHYVFNILASVQYLVLESTKEKVITFLNMFSRSLRNTLDQTRKNSLYLKQEIQFLKEYIEMERFRLEDTFDFDIQQEFPPASLEQPIPPFMIQPFVENAIQHGLKNYSGQGHLSIVFGEEYGFFKITITDNGIGRRVAGRYKRENASHNGTSHGIDIIDKRLALYNNQKDSVVTTDLIGSKGEALGTQVRILIKQKYYESTHH